jgi:hypothetical protein
MFAASRGAREAQQDRISLLRPSSQGFLTLPRALFSLRELAPSRRHVRHAPTLFCGLIPWLGSWRTPTGSARPGSVAPPATNAAPRGHHRAHTHHRDHLNARPPDRTRPHQAEAPRKAQHCENPLLIWFFLGFLKPPVAGSSPAGGITVSSHCQALLGTAGCAEIGARARCRCRTRP